MIPIAASLFFGLWRRIVKNAGGAGAIPIIGRLLPDRFRKKIDDKIDGVGK